MAPVGAPLLAGIRAGGSDRAAFPGRGPSGV